MRNYTIFLLESEVAESYFGKEMLLYTLFSEFLGTDYRHKLIVEKQVDYITREIPLFHVQQFLQKSLKEFKGFSISHKGFEVNCASRGVESIALLKVNNKCITVASQGNFEAETTFFEVLRKIDSCFFAMDYHSNHYGWLNPIKQRNFI